MTIAVRPAQKADVGELCVVLVRAFHDDPVMMWMLPDVVQRGAYVDLQEKTARLVRPKTIP